MQKEKRHKITSRLENNSGITMLEVIVALGIFSAGVMGIVQMHFLDMKQTRSLQEAYVAERLIENEWAMLQFDPAFEGDAGDEAFRHEFKKDVLRELHTQLRWTKKENGLVEVRLHVRWASTLGRMKEKDAVMMLRRGAEIEGLTAHFFSNI